MSLLARLAPHLPYVRRYARALTGDQTTGDNYVRATLEALAAGERELDASASPRVALYQVFHTIWQSAGAKLEPRDGGGTRLTLWHSIDRRFISMGAAGWHICFDVLERLLAGQPIGRIVGAKAMTFGWQRLNAEYATQFGVEPPGRSSGPA